MCVMRPDVLDHYMVRELDGQEPLKAILEGRDSKDTVIMISTRTPCAKWGITFRFHATVIKTMAQVREMTVGSVVNEDSEITSHRIPLAGKLLSWNLQM